MYSLHLLCTIFVRKTTCQKDFFQILSQKSWFRFELKNPPRVWILWIHDKFWNLTKKTQNRCLDSKIRVWIFPKTRILSLNDIKKQLGMFFNIFIILSKFAIQHSNHMASMSQWNSLQIGILNGSNVSTHWISVGEVSVLDFKKVLTPGVFCSNFNLWNKATVTLCNSFALCN